MGNFSEGGPTSNFSQRGDQIFGPGGGQGGGPIFFPMQQVQCQKTMKTSSVTKQFPMLALVGIRLAVFKNHFPSLQTGSAALGSLKPQRAKRAKFFLTLSLVGLRLSYFCQFNLVRWQLQLGVHSLKPQRAKRAKFFLTLSLMDLRLPYFCQFNLVRWQLQLGVYSLKPQRAKRAKFFLTLQ